MRLARIALFCAAASIALSSGAADPVPTSFIEPLMVKRMQGVYRLDDGRILRVSERRRKLYADTGGGPVEIVHVGRDRFEAVGRDLSLRFEGGPVPYGVLLVDASGRPPASGGR